MQILLLTNDLMCSSRVAAAAQQAAVPCEVAWNSAQLLEKAAAGAALVLLDLTARFDPAEVVGPLKALPQPPRVLAFGPHVHEAKLSAASAAGCDVVLTRGQFYAQIDSIVGQAAGNK